MKTRIVIVTSEYGNHGGGLSNSASKLYKILTDLGFIVEVVISSQSLENHTEKNIPKEKIIHNAIKVISGGYNIHLQRDLFFRGYLNQIINFLRDSLPDLIIAFGAGLNGLFASEIAGKLNAKLVVMPRGSEMNLAISNADLYHYNLECLKKATAVVSVSKELSVRAKEIHFNSSCIYKVIPNTISIPNEKNGNWRFEKKSEVVLGTGSKFLNEKKGIYNLIMAISILKSKTEKNINLRICGFIDEALKIKYVELVESLNIRDNIEFLGVLDRMEFLNEMKNWDVALQCSFCEGFSNSIGDAISIGKPFLVSNTGFIAEQISEKYPDLLFSDLSAGAIAMTIHETCFNKSISTLCKDAVALFENSVSEESVYSEWEQILREVLGRSIRTDFQYKNEHILTLMLHDLSDAEFSSVEVPQTRFLELCYKVNQVGFRFCSAVEYFKAADKKKLIICSFDDGYKSVIKYGLPILQKFGFTATVFVCSDHIGKSNNWNPKDRAKRFHMTLEELKILNDEGWEIGSHGEKHISFNRLDEKEILESITKSKNILSDTFGSVVSFAYPYGDTSAVIESLVKNHFENIFTTDKGGTQIQIDRHRIKRYSFDEIQTLFRT